MSFPTEENFKKARGAGAARRSGRLYLGGANLNGANVYSGLDGAGNRNPMAGNDDISSTGHANRLPSLADCIINGILAVAACYFLAHLFLWMVGL